MIDDVDIKFIVDETIIAAPADLTQAVRKLRKSHKITQQAMGDSLGVNQKTVSALERNMYKASFARVKEVLDLLDAEIVIRRKF